MCGITVQRSCTVCTVHTTYLPTSQRCLAGRRYWMWRWLIRPNQVSVHPYGVGKRRRPDMSHPPSLGSLQTCQLVNLAKKRWQTRSQWQITLLLLASIWHGESTRGGRDWKENKERGKAGIEAGKYEVSFTLFTLRLCCTSALYEHTYMTVQHWLMSAEDSRNGASPALCSPYSTAATSRGWDGTYLPPSSGCRWGKLQSAFSWTIWLGQKGGQRAISTGPRKDLRRSSTG